MASRRIKFPGGTIGAADGDPASMNFVSRLVETLSFFGFEVEGIGADEQRGIGPALDSQRGANVMESAAAGVQIVVGFVGFDVLIEPIEDECCRARRLRRCRRYIRRDRRAGASPCNADRRFRRRRRRADLGLLFRLERGDGPALRCWRYR